MASEHEPSAKAGKAATWDNTKLLQELAIALYQALEVTNSLNAGVKAAIPEYLAQQGHNITWGALRYV